MDDELDLKAIAKLLAPFLAGTALVAVILSLALVRFLPSTGASPVVVTFDIIKFTNSQRAVASTFLKPNSDPSNATELLTHLSERTRKSIAGIAGAGTIVVVKQAVVQGTTRDITDDVLKDLSLPTNVPTSDVTQYSLDVAPTELLAPVKPRVPNPMPGEGRDASGKVLP